MWDCGWSSVASKTEDWWIDWVPDLLGGGSCVEVAIECHANKQCIAAGPVCSGITERAQQQQQQQREAILTPKLPFKMDALPDSVQISKNRSLIVIRS